MSGIYNSLDNSVGQKDNSVVQGDSHGAPLLCSRYQVNRLG